MALQEGRLVLPASTVSSAVRMAVSRVVVMRAEAPRAVASGVALAELVALRVA